MKGRFVVLEGIDGSGTSTQAKLLHNFLKRNHRECSLTFEPSSGPIGDFIRNILWGKIKLTDNDLHREEQLSFLFAADRANHLQREGDGIETCLKKGMDVICTRYILSSLAYHSYNYDFIKYLNKNFLKPDITFYLDVSPHVAIQRINKNRKPDLNENLENLKRVKRNYEDAFQISSLPFIRIDGNQEEEIIHKQIVEALKIIPLRLPE